MHTYTKIQYVKRPAYVEVFVCYCRNGEKFRPTTGVKVNPKHITKGGDISVAHPHFEQDLQRIGLVQQRVESLIAHYIQKHNQKPSKDWLEKAYYQDGLELGDVSNGAQAQVPAPGAVGETNHVVPEGGDVQAASHKVYDRAGDTFVSPSGQRHGHVEVTPAAMVLSICQTRRAEGLERDVLCYWKDFIAEKTETVRNPNSLKRLNNAKYSLAQYCKKRNVWIPFLHLIQRFFNDYVVFMVREQEYYRNRHEAAKGNIKPSIGLNNNTAIKRLSDLVEYFKYCNVIKDVNLNLDKIKHYVEVAKKKHDVYPFKGKKRWELTLSVQEIEFVVNLDHYEPLYWKSLSDNQKRYLDILIFMCLQGTNPKDTQRTSRTDIEEEGTYKNIIREPLTHSLGVAAG